MLSFTEWWNEESPNPNKLKFPWALLTWSKNQDSQDPWVNFSSEKRSAEQVKQQNCCEESLQAAGSANQTRSTRTLQMDQGEDQTANLSNSEEKI